jgi:hypothetical protein
MSSMIRKGALPQIRRTRTGPADFNRHVGALESRSRLAILTRSDHLHVTKFTPAKGAGDKIVSLSATWRAQRELERINILAPIPGKTRRHRAANTRKVTVTLRGIDAVAPLGGIEDARQNSAR